MDYENTWGKYASYCYVNKIKNHAYKESPAYEPMKKLIKKYNKALKRNH